MNQGIHLNDYHQGVIDWLKANLPWLKSIGYYQDIRPPIQTPAASFSVMGWEPQDGQPGNGQLSVTLHCELLLVLGKTGAKELLRARNAAMATCNKVHQSSFGLPVSPAVLVGAHPDAPNDKLRGYSCWVVSWVQRATVGQSEFDDAGRDGLRLAVNPQDQLDVSAYSPIGMDCD